MSCPCTDCVSTTTQHPVLTPWYNHNVSHLFNSGRPISKGASSSGLPGRMTPLRILLCSGRDYDIRVIQCMVEKCPDAMLIEDKCPLD